MRSDGPRLAHIRDNILFASAFVDGMAYAQFCADRKCVYAVTRALEIISEASRRLSAELKARHPEIAWKDMAGAGNIYRHDYEDVLERYLWRTVHEALPPLLDAVERELAGERD